MMKNWLKKDKIQILFILCISVIIVLFAAEILVQAYQFFHQGIPFGMSVKYFLDPELGWKGKKIFGNSSSPKYKIFFIGDSYTEGCGLEEKYMYYNVIKHNLDAEIFVYAAKAYGTLQEYIVLDKYFDYINPELVILQVCYNDFIDNLWELECASFYNNFHLIRPYLINGKVEYGFFRFPGKLRLFLFSHLRIFYLLFNKAEKLLMALADKRLLHSVEEVIEEKEMSFSNFKKSTIITDDIIIKIKDRIGTPIIAFPVDVDQPYFEQFKRIFKENNVTFIEDIPKIIKEEETRGINLTLDGAHWNEVAHKICGKILTEAIKQVDYMHNQKLNTKVAVTTFE